MAGTQNEKRNIDEALAKVRIQMQEDFSRLRRDLDLGRHIVQSIRDHPSGWVSAGFVLGWLLSRWPSRKRKIYIYTADPGKIKDRRNKTTSKLWKAAWSTSKPLIAAYLAKEIAQKANAHKTARL
jgi:hypothetical protein